MDKLNIGNTILQLRKEKNITQNQLSSMIGVSAGAVCKWETGKSMPDIVLLPSLARALEVSVDTLLSFNSKLSDKDVDKIKKQLTEVFLQIGYDEGEKKCKEYLKEYPNNVNLKLIIAGLIQMHSMLIDKDRKDSEELVKSKMEYSLELLEQVVESKDSKYASSALFSTAGIQMMLENYEESEKALKKLTYSSIDPMSILPFVLHKQGKNKEAEILCEKMLLHYLNNSIGMLSTLTKISIETDKYEQALLYLDTIRKIENEFKIGLHSGAYNTCVLYIKTKKLNLGAKWFKTYVEDLLSLEYDYCNNNFFKDVKLEVDLKGQKIIRKKLFQSLMDDPDLKVLAGLPDYEQAIKMLKDNISPD